MAKKSKRLPSKPSALIRVALEDLKAVEKDPRYVVAMDDWHHPNVSTFTCEVCLAGAVMAKTLATPLTTEMTPSLFFNEQGNLTDKLHALNDFRTGDVACALNNLGVLTRRRGVQALIDRYEAMSSFPGYAADPAKFKRAMRTMANRLEKIGL